MDHLVLDIADGIAALRLDRPRVANAIDLALARELQAAVRGIIDDADVRVVVILGSGRHFCAGGDVRAMASEPVGWAAEVATAVHAATLDLHRSDKVVVAGVRGAVAGGGLGLALVADLVVATPSACFVAAWNDIGLTPDAGVSWLLPRKVGGGRASAMILGDRRVKGSEALVHRPGPTHEGGCTPEARRGVRTLVGCHVARSQVACPR